jgi:ParB family transcriptional regulator, chromosome partitioning protein
MSEYLELPLASIEVGAGRARNLDPAWIEGLAGSIQEQGLLQPIVVRKIGVGYRLVAGHHRLEAYRHLGYGQIAAVLLDVEADDADSEDAARLAEIMENLGRYELIALDRCQHLFELKQIWERMYPETRAGVAGGKARQGSANEIFSFATATAEKIGLSQRSIQIAVKIWAGRNGQAPGQPASFPPDREPGTEQGRFSPRHARGRPSADRRALRGAGCG